MWEPAASRTKPRGVTEELHTRAWLHVGQGYSEKKNKQRKGPTFGLACAWRPSPQGHAVPRLHRVHSSAHCAFSSGSCLASSWEPSRTSLAQPPPLRPLGAEWMWPWALGRWPLSVRVSLSGSGEDRLLSRAQCPADTRKSDGSEGPPMSLVLRIAPSSCLGQGSPVIYACCANMIWCLAAGTSTHLHGDPEGGDSACGRAASLPPPPASPWDLAQACSSAASGSLDLEQGGKRRWDVAGGGHTVLGVVPAWRLT